MWTLEPGKSFHLYLFSWLGTLIGTLQSCGLWNFLYVVKKFLYKSCCLLFILGHCKHNLDSLTHKCSPFFCYLERLVITTWFIIIFEVWQISACRLKRFPLWSTFLIVLLSWMSWCLSLFWMFWCLYHLIVMHESFCFCLLSQDYLACLLRNNPDTYS